MTAETATHHGQTIVKNVGVMMVSQLITWALTLALTVVLPRYLGPAHVGQFYVANAIWAIVGMLVSFGTDTLLVKEIARHPHNAPDLLGTSFFMRLGAFAMSCVIVSIYLWAFDYSTETMPVVAIMGVAQPFLLVGSACTAALQGFETMEYVSLSIVLSKAVNTGVALTLIMLGYGVYAIAAVSILSMLTLMLPQLIIVWRRSGIRFRVNIAPAFSMIRAGLPYLVSGLTLVIYLQVHSLIISTLVNVTAVGWYSSAVQLYSTLMFIPVVLATAVFPSITRAHVSDTTLLPKLVRRSFDIMLMISIPIGIGLAIIADPLVVLLFGQEFAPSGPILSVLGIALVFTYLNTLLGQLLISIDRQNIWTIVMVASTVLTVLLDVAFVPFCAHMFGNGAIGGAISFLITELVMTVTAIRLLPHGTLGRSNARTAALITLAGIIMAASCWWSREQFIGIPVLIGAATYTALVVLLQLVPRDDAQMVLHMVSGLIQRLRHRTTKSIRAVEG